MPTENKVIYWFPGDVCGNLRYSDNLPASDTPYVEDTLIDMGSEIKHRLKYNDHTRNIVVPKKQQKDPKFLRAIHNAVHKFLEDGKRESVKYIEAGKHQFCTRKQYEKFISTKK